jgi:beta-lactamase superfamily II metal-dependent hydrolase
MIPFWSETSMRPDPEHLLIQIAGSIIAGCACTFFVPCVILCYLLPFWDQYLSSPLRLCLDVLYKLVVTGSSLTVKSGMPVHLSKCLSVILGLTIFLYMIPPCMFRKILIKPAAAVLAFVIGLESFSVLKRTDCRVVFADVGQGDCCLIITPDKTCLIDAGTYKEGNSTVCDLLDYYGIYQVDYCVMSHWDSDHAGGFAALSGQGRIKSILTSYVPSSYVKDKDKDVQEFLISNCSDPESELSFRSKLSMVLAGDRIDLSDSVYLDVLYPSVSSGGGNESSLVVMLHIIGKEETSILFTGDIGTTTETLLIEKGIDLDCDILKVAHHGSKYSSSGEFIEVCSPDIAVISVGAHNFYGHPSSQTLSRFDSYGCEIFRTDTEGAVVLEY